MTTPKDLRFASGMGTPNEAPVEMDDAEDRTSRVTPELSVELPPLPVETTPGLLRLLPKLTTVTRPPNGAPNVAPLDELIGRRCGGYVIDALLGEGGMGKVYLATNPRMGKRAAVKVIRPDHSNNPQTIDRFLQEARAAAQIDDPNIIDLLDANELEDGRAYLLLPFVEGTSLEELCEQHVVLPLEMAAAILFQICSGLDAAHQHGIIHRDIKPHNILVGPRQQREHFVRIVDFGIAKLLDPHLAGNFKTQTLALMGTPGYMAPEQAAGGRNIDARADVYAVAVVAYRMLTGRRPYMEDSLYALISKQVSNAPFPRPRELRPDLPIEWDEAIMAALVNNRDQRLATVRELAHRLARGLPEGEQMLRALAPRLAESRLPPTAPTLNPFLDHDIARRTGKQSSPARPQGKRIGLAPWHLALLTGVLLGVGGIGGLAAGIFRADQPGAVPDEVTASSASTVASRSSPGEAAVAPAPTEVRDAGDTARPTSAAERVQDPAIQPAGDVSQAPVPAAPEEVRQGARPSQAASTQPPATQAPAAPRQVEGRTRGLASEAARAPRNPSASEPPKAEGASATGEKAPEAGLSRDESARLAKLGIGMLIVNAKPWAQISINGKLEGYTPKRKQLPVGRYVIRMTKDERNEDVVVVISPGKVSTIERSFR